jgi:hypothetical protein
MTKVPSERNKQNIRFGSQSGGDPTKFRVWRGRIANQGPTGSLPLRFSTSSIVPANCGL